MRDESHSLLRFFYHLSLKKKKKVCNILYFLMIEHFKSMFTFIILLNLKIILWRQAKQGLAGLQMRKQ